MLETKNLTKIYKPKKGVPVKALDDVSLKFSDKGMVFLLGKSGSGKSTLLNLLGGLDSYDSGEIIIKGVSSKNFKQSHFDSYRNTYVGFIFQEYNILEEFTVGANIALALELQGKKATDEAINKILTDVDLQGYGSRRPNELSGGQKQRVAIARALVKNPKIIMADEPSGALDSATGKQVFDTLKRLSREKLVIVVSHDRDFALDYADRIIELADGRVISDTVATHDEESVGQGIVFEGNTAKISADYRLTEQDRIAINEYLDKIQGGVDISVTESKTSKRFTETDNERIESSDKTPFALIKSKLSLKHAFKIGAGGLKYKKFRLVMTVLLSCISFTLFGLVDTFSAYNHIDAIANSIYDSEIRCASISKKAKVTDGDYEYWTSYGVKLSDAEIKTFSEETGVALKGAINASGGDLGFYSSLQSTDSATGSTYYELYARTFSGIVEITQADIDSMGYELVAGRLPDGSKNEMAISEYICRSFMEYGYQNMLDKNADADINSASDMLGKSIYVAGDDYTVVGVIDTKLDWDRYSTLLEQSENTEASGEILNYVLYLEFSSATSDSFTGMMLVGEGGLAKYRERNPLVTEIRTGYLEFIANGNEGGFSGYRVTTLENVSADKIIWLDGEKKTLAENEIIISSIVCENHLGACYTDENGELVIDKARLRNAYTMRYESYMYGNSASVENVRIVGIANAHQYDLNYEILLPESFYDEHISFGGEYDVALGAMPSDKGDIKRFAEYCYSEHGDISFKLNNPAAYELDSLNDVIEELARIFLYIGIAFAVFASILLSNFIATSISYKKQEIGILRAIGSRGNDVFRIFFSESFIIAMINFLLACVGTATVTGIINAKLRELGLLVTVLDFGIRQIAILLAVSVAVAAIASFLPVKRIASKKPIDAIRNR